MDVKYFDHLVQRWCRVDMVVVNDSRFLETSFFNIIIDVRESTSVFSVIVICGNESLSMVYVVAFNDAWL